MKVMQVANISDSENISIAAAMKRGADFLASIQLASGCWKGDYGGPMFLLPMYVGVCYITGQHISGREREEFIRYFKNVQNGDGSIGLHAEGAGCMFSTVLCYAALRMLGVSRDETMMKIMREWVVSRGSALGAASWGKFFMALLNLYPYEGLNPLLPELWVLPYRLPFHPGRLWCHARQVYLPMAYLYGIKAQMKENNLIREIRRDIYDADYNKINFRRYRNAIMPADEYVPYSRLLKCINLLQIFYENHHVKKLRSRALAVIFDHILYEDMATNYIDIGPVNSVLNTLVHHFIDKEGENFIQSFKSLKTYLWEGHDGMKMNGYNSTALWDTAFSVQSIYAAHLEREYEQCLLKAYNFIRDNQVTEDLSNHKKYFRHTSRGGWPFSDREHGWPITDCTSEGFKAEQLIRKSFHITDLISDSLLEESVKLILSLQNRDGGWATYERQRAGKWLELLNPSGVFGDIMIDCSYVECSSSCIQALARAQTKFSGSLRRQIENAIWRGARFIKSKQRPDGSFEGSWGVCFTYGTWFGVWGLLDAGVRPDSCEIQAACRFLIEHQNEDGGWGESYLSCKERRWIDHAHSQVVNTSWALMTLVRAGVGHSIAAEMAANFIVDRQMENGDWPRESLVGVFNKTALINYENYRRYFPVWALGVYLNK